MFKTLNSSLGLIPLFGILLGGTISNASVAPIPGAPLEHAPYAEKMCSICHERDDQNNPGKISGPVNDLCMMCHDDFKNSLSALPHIHAAAKDKCTNCHNPHNSSVGYFLHDSPLNLCLSCHQKVGTLMGSAKTQHGATTSDKSCLNCHNPHGSKVEKLLNGLPYDLCVNCHNRSDILDHNGKKLTNIKELIESRKFVHSPVAEKDCSSCHVPHASNTFRLLTANYPAKFYAPFDPENYELCFTCHDSAMVTERATTALTGFRNGSKNLHFLHVNQERGRTCRACHEVHAAEKPHNIRDGVPYGNGGWVLKINYEMLPEGGRCTKTCHTTREYRR